MREFRAAQIDRLVVGADHRHHQRLRRDAAGVIVELHRIGDVEMFAGRQIVEGEIGCRERRVDDAVARAGGLHDAVDMEEPHQLGGAETPGQEAVGGARGRYAGHGRGVPGIGEVVVSEIQRDMGGVRRQRQRLIGLFGEGRDRSHADDGPCRQLHLGTAILFLLLPLFLLRDRSRRGNYYETRGAGPGYAPEGAPRFHECRHCTAASV